MENRPDEMIPEGITEKPSEEPVAQSIKVPDDQANEEEVEESTEDFAAMLEESFSRLGNQVEEGQIVRGTIVKLDKEIAFVDLGGKSEGVIEIQELKDSEGNISANIGDEVEATVVGSPGDEGTVRLSRSLAKSARSREQLIEAYQNRLAVEGRVTSRNKGGFEVQIAGMKAFAPLSQMDMNYTPDPDVFLGQTLTFRIMEFKNNGRNVVLSRAALQREEAEEKAKILRESLKEGDVITGRVRSIRDFGAFVELGGLDGLLHVSEISWGRVDNPREVLEEGQEVTVRVIRYDRDRDRISLSMKDLEPSPWEEVGTKYREGGVHTGVVRRLESFGAFVEIAPGLDGLLHVSNMVWGRRIAHPKEVVKVGETVTVQILSIDLEKKRLSLGMKQVGGDPWDEVDQKYPVGLEIEGEVEKVAPFGLFVKLEAGVTGLVPNVEMGTARGSDHNKDFPPGSMVKVKVLEVNLVDRKISLSRKALLDSGDKQNLREYSERSKVGGNLSGGSSLGTLGDILSGIRVKDG